MPKPPAPRKRLKPAAPRLRDTHELPPRVLLADVFGEQFRNPKTVLNSRFCKSFCLIPSSVSGPGETQFWGRSAPPEFFFRTLGGLPCAPEATGRRHRREASAQQGSCPMAPLSSPLFFSKPILFILHLEMDKIQFTWAGKMTSSQLASVPCRTLCDALNLWIPAAKKLPYKVLLCTSHFHSVSRRCHSFHQCFHILPSLLIWRENHHARIESTPLLLDPIGGPNLWQHQ